MKNFNLKSVFVVFAMLIFCQAEAQKNIKIGLEIGNKAPELKLLSPDGELISLSSLKGKMVLIDFWASWCGPCRNENVNVVNAYKLFKNKKFKTGKGFTVLSVSLDSNKEKWKQAIKQDNLVWPYHISDLKSWKSSAAQKYRIHIIPNNFLVDAHGIIIAKTLRGERLEYTLKKLLKK